MSMETMRFCEYCRALNKPQTSATLAGYLNMLSQAAGWREYDLKEGEGDSDRLKKELAHIESLRLDAISTAESGGQIGESQIVNDPAASCWLKRQITETEQRDPVDALHDAEMLVMVLQARLSAITEQGKEQGRVVL